MSEKFYSGFQGYNGHWVTHLSPSLLWLAFLQKHPIILAVSSSHIGRAPRHTWLSQSHVGPSFHSMPVGQTFCTGLSGLQTILAQTKYKLKDKRAKKMYSFMLGSLFGSNWNYFFVFQQTLLIGIYDDVNERCFVSWRLSIRLKCLLLLISWKPCNFKYKQEGKRWYRGK